MTLFDQHSPFDQTPKIKKTSQQRRRSWGLTLLVGSLILVLGLAAVPTGFVVQQPGPVFNTLGEIEIPATQEDSSAEKIELITIEGTTSYPTDGSLDLLTVSVLGNPEQTPSWLELAGAWFDPTKAVVPLDAIFPDDESAEEREEITTAQMVDSQQDAIAAALTHQGYDVVIGATVMGFREDSPAQGVLQEGDIITAVNGVSVESVPVLREQLSLNGTSKPALIDFLRNGEPQQAQITPVDIDGNIVLAIGVKLAYDFPFEVSIRLDDVGGPSAGLMFALGIIDKLTPEQETAGIHYAGTGTIDPSGNVGGIGGVRQKLFGAQQAGASVAFIPADNCEEARGGIPSELTVFSVKTLDEALDVMAYIKVHGQEKETLSEMSGTFPTCQN